MRRFYISHPYTGNEEINKANAKNITTRLQRDHAEDFFVNPLALMESCDEAGLDYPQIIHKCLEEMKLCQGIIMAPGWLNSQGCRKERDEATRCGLIVFDSIAIFEDWADGLFTDTLWDEKGENL